MAVPSALTSRGAQSDTKQYKSVSCNWWGPDQPLHVVSGAHFSVPLEPAASAGCSAAMRVCARKQRSVHFSVQYIYDGQPCACV